MACVAVTAVFSSIVTIGGSAVRSLVRLLQCAPLVMDRITFLLVQRQRHRKVEVIPIEPSTFAFKRKEG